MYEAKELVFYTCVSPVHMGAGSAVGAIDNPIQREVHTEYPLIAGSGIKGAVRHHFARAWGDGETKFIDRIFGPGKGENASAHAGAIAFTDAALVAFPVRSLKNTFIYATSPTALGRLKRLAEGAAPWIVPAVAEGNALLATTSALTGTGLVLEAFEFKGEEDSRVQLIAQWLARHSLPASAEYDFFREKIKSDLVVLSDTEFSYFVRHATVVEAHVAISNEKGTAERGKLFYTENLPPETILAGLVMASVERRESRANTNGMMKAKEVIDAVLKDGNGGRQGLTDHLLQVGGDATTGRGLLVVTAHKEPS